MARMRQASALARIMLGLVAAGCGAGSLSATAGSAGVSAPAARPPTTLPSLEDFVHALSAHADQAPAALVFRRDAGAPEASAAWEAWDTGFAALAAPLLASPAAGTILAGDAAVRLPADTLARLLAYYLWAACEPRSASLAMPDIESEAIYSAVHCGAALARLGGAATPFRGGLWDPARRFALIATTAQDDPGGCGVLYARVSPAEVTLPGRRSRQ